MVIFKIIRYYKSKYLFFFIVNISPKLNFQFNVFTVNLELWLPPLYNNNDGEQKKTGECGKSSEEKEDVHINTKSPLVLQETVILF